MTDAEKKLKNDVLDALEFCYDIVSRFNNGDMISFKENIFDDDLKELKETIHRLRNADILEDNNG